MLLTMFFTMLTSIVCAENQTMEMVAFSKPNSAFGEDLVWVESADPETGMTKFEFEIFELVNNAREKRGLPKIIPSPVIAAGGRGWCKFLHQNRHGQVGHYNGNENACFFPSASAQAVLNGWSVSPGHAKFMFSRTWGSGTLKFGAVSNYGDYYVLRYVSSLEEYPDTVGAYHAYVNTQDYPTVEPHTRKVPKMKTTASSSRKRRMMR
jgi:uncharacterized protein YkwD